MLEWLVPISLFWTLIATYLGGWPVTIKGGTGPRQVLGLLITFALYLVVWGVVHRPMAGFNLVVRVALPTVLCVLALPLFTWAGFRIMGVRIALHHGTAH